MAIVNLTDNLDRNGLPRIAKLHKGEKKVDANRPGKDLEYFRVEFEPEFRQYADVWEDLFGDKPDHFDRVFMTDATVNAAFDTWKEEWNASQTLLHRCDGENQVQWYNTQANMYMTSKTPCAMQTAHKCACTHVGRLNLIIPDFIEVTGVLGTVLCETHSINDILTIYGMLANIQKINGTLLGIPFTLGRADQKISAPNKKQGTRIKVTKSLFYLHVDPEFTRETLLPRLAANGGFLNANQPALPAPQVAQIDTDHAKKLLGQGSATGPRRMGDEPAVTAPAAPAPAAPQTEKPAEPAKVEPPKAEPPQTTIIGIDTVGNALGKLKTRALEEIFAKNVRTMNSVISELTASGKLPPVLTIDEALQRIREAHKPQPVTDPVSQELFEALPGMNEPSAAMQHQFEV